MADGIDLWIVDAGDAADAALHAACAAVATGAEQAAAARFARDDLRRERLAARALVRCALTARFGGAVADWRFEADGDGRPRLAPGGAATGAPGQAAAVGAGADFNLAHSGGAVACAVAEGARLGVDLEPLHRADAIRTVAAKALAPSERDAATVAPGPEADFRLVALWTLKEAYAKALGIGLALPFIEIAFAWDGTPGEDGAHEARMAQQAWMTPEAGMTLTASADRFAPEAGPVPAAPPWRFRLWRRPDGRVVALAVRAAGAVRPVRVGDGRALILAAARALMG